MKSTKRDSASMQSENDADRPEKNAFSLARAVAEGQGDLEEAIKAISKRVEESDAYKIRRFLQRD